MLTIQAQYRNSTMDTIRLNLGYFKGFDYRRLNWPMYMFQHHLFGEIYRPDIKMYCESV